MLFIVNKSYYKIHVFSITMHRCCLMRLLKIENLDNT